MKLNKWFERIEFFSYVIALGILGYTALSAISTVIVGNFAFWYDPARDLLAAVENLHKPTLIGPPSGIPGVFYGPYWIWLLSLGVVVTKDPRIALLIVGIIPYIVLFPLFLFKLSPILDRKTLIILLVFWSFNRFLSYTVSLWNPNLAPFFFLLLVLTLLSLTFTKVNRKTFLLSFLTGFLVGIIMNFHLSFGIGVLSGTTIYLLGYSIFSIRKKKTFGATYFFQNIAALFVYATGLTCAFLPFLLFELRHNFLQIHNLHIILADAIFYNSAAVGQLGLDNVGIIKTFLHVFSSTLQINDRIVYLGVIALCVYIVILWRKRYLSKVVSALVTEFKKNKKGKLLLILLSVFSTTFFFYISSKNPVWDYHFIGIDIIFLLLLGIGITTFPKAQKVLALWMLIVIFLRLPTILQRVTQLGKVDTQISSLAMKERAVKQIYQDGGNKEFFVAAYSSALYTFDYDYLFAWKGRKELIKDPQVVLKGNDPIYLLVPRKASEVKLDFIHYFSTQSAFTTTKAWVVGEDIEIIKREKTILSN